MTAISKSYVIPTDAATDVDSPADQAVFQGLRDCIIFVKEWLGESFFAGAVQNPNHDGVNSALVEIGPNAIRNGSFELDGDGWTITDYTGGSHSFSTTNDMDGAKALAITSTVTANGGGKAVSGEYRSCAATVEYGFLLLLKASVANVSSRVRVLWYDDAKSQISTSDVYSSTNTPTAATLVRANLVAPSNAKFYQLQLEGGVPGSGSSAGTIYFDGVVGLGVTDTQAYSVGGYVIGRSADLTNNWAVGNTVAGSGLYATTTDTTYTGAGWTPVTGVTLVGVGSWKCVSPAHADGTTGRCGLWLRIA